MRSSYPSQAVASGGTVAGGTGPAQVATDAYGRPAVGQESSSLMRAGTQMGYYVSQEMPPPNMSAYASQGPYGGGGQQQYADAAQYAAAGQRMNSMMAAAYQQSTPQSGFQASPAMQQPAGLFMPQQSQGQNAGMHPSSIPPSMLNAMQASGNAGHYMTATSQAAMMEMYRRSAMMRQSSAAYGGYQQGYATAPMGPPPGMLYAPNAALLQQQQQQHQRLSAQQSMGMLARRMPNMPAGLGVTDLQRKPGKPPPRRPPPRSNSSSLIAPVPETTNGGGVNLLSVAPVSKPPVKAKSKIRSTAASSGVDDDQAWGYEDAYEEDNDDDDDDYDPRGGLSNRKKSASGASRPTRASVAKRKRAIKMGDESFDASEASSVADQSNTIRSSRRAAAQANWATHWARGEDSPGGVGTDSLVTRTSRKRKLQDRRRAIAEDLGWGPGPHPPGIVGDSSEADDGTWTSDVDSELLSGVGLRTGVYGAAAGTKRRKAGGVRGGKASEAEAAVHHTGDILDDDDDEDDLDGGFSSHRRRVEVCILDCPSATGPAGLGVDRVVNHRDDYIDPETGETLNLNTDASSPPTPPSNIARVETPATAPVTPPEGAVKVRRYLIKWQGRSHLHNSWLSLEEVQQLQVTGIKKVTNYIKKQEQIEQKKLYMSEDEIEQMVIALELQRQLDQDALVPERIVTHTEVEAPPPILLEASSPQPHAQAPHATAAESDDPLGILPSTSSSSTMETQPPMMMTMGESSSLPPPSGLIDDGSQMTSIDHTHGHHTGHHGLMNPANTTSGEGKPMTTVFLVKWTSCPYDQCTWETEDFMIELGFQSLIDSYRERESRISGEESAHNPLNQHDLSENNFEPYTTTPSFLGAPAPGSGSAASGPPGSGSTSAAPGPKNLTLRDYQLTGVNWIISRMKKDLSVLLADEMGLGKTAQTITVVGHMIYHEKVAGPFLIVVPQSTMDNWLSEFQTWLPNANVVLYHGNPSAREIVRREEMKIVTSRQMSEIAFKSFKQPRSKLSHIPYQNLRQVVANRVRYRCDVIITTTSILQCPEDLAHLRSIPWYFMAVDEAHQLKNRESKRFKELCQFKPRYKLLLSGTPLHNNLEELWSLLHFMNPLIYNSLQQFQASYSEVEKTDSVGELKARQLNQLQRELSDVVLRRVKRDVLKSLPNKVEWILRVELSPRQSELCKDVVLRNYESLSKSTGGQKLSLQNICVELKKICNHPFLLHRPEDRETFNKELLWSSGKMCLLDKLLNRLKEKGHRVLIFSQMVRMLNLLSTFLTIRGFKHQRLDGTMSRDVRKKAMDHFNAPNSDDFCFLLSTKAGGLGINLTSADTVIIYDSDWNPQNDLQAEARAHRIGQTKTVQIYRIVTKDSVEEDILERAKAKMVLDALVVQGLNVKAGIRENDLLNGTGGAGSKNFAFSREELTKILMFGATKLWNKKEEEDSKPPGQDGSASGAEGGVNIDLDAVLAEAEEHTTEASGGRAEDLLSSFQNVSDFRYEAPKTKDEDKLAWDAIIPLEERLKFASQEAETTASKAAAETTGAGRSRNKGGSQRAAAKRSAKDRALKDLGPVGNDEDDYQAPDQDDYDSEEEESSEAPKGRKRGLTMKRRSTKAGASSTRPASRVGSRRGGDKAPVPVKKALLSDRERYKLSRAMIKYGTPAIRLDDVVKDARLGKFDGQLVVEEANALLAQCQEELALQCGSTEGVRLTATEGKLGVVETQVETQAGRKKASLVSLQWGNGYSCSCRELLDRVKLLKSLHNVIAAQNIHTDEPWKLPSSELVLELPDIPAFRHGDSNILRGIYLHGFANWQKIASDAGLAVGVDDFVKRVKSDKIKVKANRLLNAVHALFMRQNSSSPSDALPPELAPELSPSQGQSQCPIDDSQPEATDLSTHKTTGAADEDDPSEMPHATAEDSSHEEAGSFVQGEETQYLKVESQPDNDEAPKVQTGESDQKSTMEDPTPTTESVEKMASRAREELEDGEALEEGEEAEDDLTSVRQADIEDDSAHLNQPLMGGFRVSLMSDTSHSHSVE